MIMIIIMIIWDVLNFSFNSLSLHLIIISNFFSFLKLCPFFPVFFIPFFSFLVISHSISISTKINVFFQCRLDLAWFFWSLRVSLVMGSFFIPLHQRNPFYRLCVIISMLPGQCLLFWPSFCFVLKLFRYKQKVMLLFYWGDISFWP